MSVVLSSVVLTALISAAIATGAIGLTVALVLLVRRRRRALHVHDESLVDLVHELELRMDDMRRELADALERTREESRRSRVFGELAGSIDLDEVLRRTLDAAGAIPGADAALVTVIAPDGEIHTATAGLSEEEVEQHAVGRPPSGRRIRSMTVAYEPEAEPAPGQLPAVGVGLAVPIHADLEPIGLVSIFSRGGPDIFSSDQARELEDLALRAGPAIDNARRFREARQLADLDALTGLHNRRYFHETLAREVARAQRYERQLALVVLDLDDFKAINDRVGHLAGDTVLAHVAERVRDVVRSADVACRVGGDEFAVIMSESALQDAEQLYRRLQTHVSSRPIPEAGRLLLSAGIAELRAQDDAVGFFQRADDALYRAKEAGKGRVAAAASAIGASPAGRGGFTATAISEVEGFASDG